MNFHSIILIIYILLSFTKSFNITPGILDIKEYKKSHRRRIEEEGNEKEEEKNKFNPIIIGYDYTQFDSDKDINKTIKDNIRQLLEEVKDKFQTILSVKHKNVSVSQESLNELIETRCKINITLSNDTYENIIEKNDITIFPVFEDFNSEKECENIIKGYYCLLTRDKFPKGGVLKIKKNINFTEENSYKNIKYILFHQMTHIFIFEPNLMKSLDMVKDNQVITEGLKKIARNHFNCDKFTEDDDFGLPLETDGYHWDSRYMLGDYMISFDYYDKTLSDLTLVLFDDSGLYNVKNLYGKYFNFGKNKTCSFFDKKCIENDDITFDEFCIKENEPKCSQSRINKGKCYIQNYDEDIPEEYNYFNNSKGGIKQMEYCPVSNESNYFFSSNCKNNNGLANKIYGEKYGNNSFCFISSLTSNDSNVLNNDESICYEVECDYINKIIIVNVNNTQINCYEGNDTISNPSGFIGNLTCPKYNDICDKNINDTCTDMFDCIRPEFARDNIFDDEDSYKFIQINILLIFIFLFIL